MHEAASCGLPLGGAGVFPADIHGLLFGAGRLRSMPKRTLVAVVLVVVVVAAIGLSARSGDRPRSPLAQSSAARAATPRSDLPPPTEPATVVLPGIPHVLQKPDFCGEACVAAWLQRLGLDVDQDDVFNQSGLDPHLGRGCYTKELARAMKNLGLATGKVWYSVNVQQAPRQLDALWQQVRADLQAGLPSIVCTRFDFRPNTTEHFRLIVGHDIRTDEVLYHDPAVSNGAYLRMKRSTLLDLWPLGPYPKPPRGGVPQAEVSGSGGSLGNGSEYQPETRTVIWLRMQLEKRPAVPVTTGLTAADFAQHVMQLKTRLPDESFTVSIQKPFVVIGDESPEVVRARSENTVKWAIDNLKASFFDKEPAEILDIWLFRDKTSYEKHATALFDAPPHTPYGYYSARHKALVMNIATGGGTLVHEIVHPFVAADFPACPSWLNEGLGSLFEQCGLVEGRIAGLTNWRLAGLQEAIRAGRLPTFKNLCSTTTAEFYDDPGGTNYAQSRYLCYYLQEHGLLVKFYREFRACAADDPTGYKTLVAVLGTDDMARFQADWEAYVLKLRFP